MNGKPYYFKYFSHTVSEYEDWSQLDDLDMSWIDELNKARAQEKAARIKDDLANGRNPNTYCSAGEEMASKCFADPSFPLYNEWPLEFRETYECIVKTSTEKVKAMVATAEVVFKADNLTLYVDCEDGNHYFSTPYFARGDIQKTILNCSLDSVDTAVYAFMNDYREWESEHGDAYRKACLLSSLEAQRTPVSGKTQECDHEDLGSFGYKHGDTVRCPFCGERAVVW